MDGMQVDKNGDGKEAGSGRRGGEMFILSDESSSQQPTATVEG